MNHISPPTSPNNQSIQPYPDPNCMMNTCIAANFAVIHVFIIQFGSGYGWMDCLFGGVRGDMWFMLEYGMETRKASWLIFTSVGLVVV